jgi:phage gpG-like protein
MPLALTITSDSSPIDEIFKRLNQFNADQFQLFDEIGAELSHRVQARFLNGIDVDGNPWKISWRARLQGGQTLRDTGRLMNSYTHNVLSNGVEVGTNVEYAPYLHFGAKILPKNGQYITFAVGGQYRKVKEVNLTPRTQLGLNVDDEKAVLDIVGGFIDDYILRSA